MYADVRDVLIDDRFDRDARLVRLAGWRDEDVAQALEAGWRLRLAPAARAAGAAAGVWYRSPAILAVFALTAVAGLFARNHPVEILANAVAVWSGRTPQPPNRAGRRLGCLLGTVQLGGAAIAYAVGAPGLGRSLALPFAAVAAFVASTNICVPSIILTLLAGSETCTHESVLPLSRRGVAGSR